MPVINFAGLASGIDSEALIDAVSAAARQQRIVPQEERISEYEDENDALDELKTKLTELQTLTYGFSSANAGGIAKQADSTNENIVSATASNGASAGTYELTVNQLAKNATFSFNNDIASSTSAALAGGESGNIDITLGGTALTSIAITDTTTWAQITDQINALSPDIAASVVQVSPGVSRLMISSRKTGLDDGALLVNVTGTASNTLGSLSVDGVTDDPALDAEFTMSGIAGTITRGTNIVSDLITGVTLSLESDSVTPVKITIETDVETTKARMQEFVELFNEIITYVQEQSSIVQEGGGDNIENIFGALAASKLDDNAVRALKDAMFSSSYSSGVNARIFADLGITTARDGTLAFDEDVFETALSSEPDSVDQILKNYGDTTGVTGGTIDQYIRFNGLLDVTTQNNDERIKDLEDRITQAEDSIEKQEAQLRQRFARLEATVGQMQSDQQALSSALAGLGNG